MGFFVFPVLAIPTIIAAGLAIAHLQKRDDDKNLGYAALAFQILFSLMLAVTFVAMGQGLHRSLHPKSGGLRTLSEMTTYYKGLIFAVVISVALLICMVIGNIMFYASYFDKNEKNDSKKLYDNITTGFQATIPLYAAAIFLYMISFPCLMNSHGCL